MSTEGKILPRKRLIVCCDGTWQTGDKTYGTSPSNIVKLSRMIGRQSVPEGIPQVVYYQSGVGTGDFVSGIFQGSFGWGLADNVASAYHYLSANFEQGNGKGSPDEEDSNHKTYSNDEIFLFGFSRGAYTARALGGLITEMGLLKPKYLNDFPRAYEIYKKLGKMAAPKDPSESPISSPISRYVSELTTDEREFWNHLACDKEDGKTFRHVKIKAIGVWDTVGALGIPDSPLTTTFPQVNGRYQFHNTSLNGDIENAFQALALDERRGAFPPTLWYLPNEHSKDEFSTDGSSKNSPCTNLKQCWFPGFHESIGGGGVGIQYWFQHWFPKLSTIFMPDTSEMHEVTLAWMCDQVDGLLSFDEATVEYILLRHGKNRHNWASCKEFDMMHILFFFRLILFGGSRTRKPGRYYRSDVQTNESIHPSVCYRTELPYRYYMPAPLNERFFSFYQFAVPVWRFHVPRGALSLIGQKLKGRISHLENWSRKQQAPIWFWLASFLTMVRIQMSVLDDIWNVSCTLLCNSGLPIGCWEERKWEWKKQETAYTQEKQKFPMRMKALSFLFFPVAIPVFCLKLMVHLLELLFAFVYDYLSRPVSVFTLPLLLFALTVGLFALPTLLPVSLFSIPFIPVLLGSSLIIGLVALPIYFFVSFLAFTILRICPNALGFTPPQRNHFQQGKAKWVRKEVQPVLLKASQDRVELPEWIIRQSSEKINFEAKILPSDLEEEPPSGTPGDNPENQQYWTRTIWPLPNPVIRRNINMRPYWNDLEGM